MKNRPPEWTVEEARTSSACLRNDGYPVQMHGGPSFPHRSPHVNRDTPFSDAGAPVLLPAPAAPSESSRRGRPAAADSLPTVTDTTPHAVEPARLTQETYDRLQAELEDLTTRAFDAFRKMGFMP